MMSVCAMPVEDSAASAASAKSCRNCGAPANRPRGLCRACYFQPEVRERFASTSRFGKRMAAQPRRLVRPLPRPTSAPPGSPEKIAEIELRLTLGLSLWHPGDARDDLD